MTRSSTSSLSPRSTRTMPSLAPVGSVSSRSAYGPYQSWHHSTTSSSMPLSFPSSVRPSSRHAYSHSASVGSRYGLPSFALSHSQNATASYQVAPTAFIVAELG